MTINGDRQANGTIKPSHTILKLPEVMEKTKLARPSVYRHIKAGTFPAPINLGERAVGWVESEIDAWIEQRMQARYVDASVSM
jgi:prophage regulatory protein